MKREAEGFGVLGTALFFVLVLTPTALRFVEWYERETPPIAVLREAQLAEELGRLGGSLRSVTEELESATGFRLDETALKDHSAFTAVLCDALPLDDPSPGRRSLLVRWPGDAETLPSAKHPAAAAFGQRLVGIIRSVAASLPVGRLELLDDPSFRVKFRSGESLGILRGTGRVDEDGYPQLDVHHIQPLQDLPEGAEVFTAGGDGVFPAGLLVGKVVRARTGDRQTVAGTVRSDELKRVVALIYRWPTIDGRGTFSRRRRL